MKQQIDRGDYRLQSKGGCLGLLVMVLALGLGAQNSGVISKTGNIIEFMSQKDASIGQRSSEWRCDDPEYAATRAKRSYAHTYCRNADGSLTRDGNRLKRFIVSGGTLPKSIEVDADDRLDAIVSIGLTVYTREEWRESLLNGVQPARTPPPFPVVTLEEAYRESSEAWVQRRSKELGCLIKRTDHGDGMVAVEFVDEGGNSCPKEGSK